MSLFADLNRRNVFRVAAAYLVLGWVVLQVADVLFEALELPAVWNRAVVGLLVLGFIPAVVFSWVYELTPEGLKKESEIGPGESITAHTSKKLNVALVALLAVAVALFGADRLGLFGDRAQDEPAVVVAGPEPLPSAAAGSATERSIAVLPFVNMSTDAENEYFADGISEEILNLLADVQDLSVASRTSAFAFKGKDTPIPEIARQLDVRYVLEGSVRKAGGQVRVTAQLIDASTDRHLWSETYDRRLDDIFAIQDDIAGAIGDALQLELLGTGGKRITSEAIDPDIYAMFLEARHLLRQRSAPALRKANELLIRVVEAEPSFARGHVVLGEAYLLNTGSAQQIVPREIGEAQARMHAEVARSIDPDLGGIYLILGELKSRDANLIGALELFSQAIELEPAEPRPYHWRGMVFSTLGFLDRAHADLVEAVRLEPDNANANGWLSTIESGMGNTQRAVELALRQAELGNPAGLRQASSYQIAAGDIDGAAASLARADQLEGKDPEYSRAVIAVARDPAAVPQLEAAIDRKLYGSDDYDLVYHLVALHRFDLLEQYLETSPQGAGLSSLPTMVWNDSFAEFRRSPQFSRWTSRNGATVAWDALGPPPDCRREGEGYVCGYSFPRQAD